MFITVFTTGVIRFTHLTLLHPITLIIPGEQYELCNSSLYNILHSPLTSAPLRPNSSLSTVLSLTVTFRSSTVKYRATGHFTAAHSYTAVTHFAICFSSLHTEMLRQGSQHQHLCSEQRKTGNSASPQRSVSPNLGEMLSRLLYPAWQRRRL